MRILRKKLALLAAPLLSLAVLAAWAPRAQAATAWAFYEQTGSACIVAASNSVYDQGGCPAASAVNHVGLWYPIDEGTDPVTGNKMYVFENVHFLNCLTIGDTGGPYGAPCPTGSGLNGVNHVQLWTLVPSSRGSEIVNIHTRRGLFWNSSSSAITQTGSAANEIWAVGFTTV